MKHITQFLSLLLCLTLFSVTAAATTYDKSYLNLENVTSESINVNEDGDLQYIISAKVTTPENTLHHVSVQFKNPRTDETLTKILYRSDLISDSVYAGSLTVNRFTRSGTYYLDKVTIVDQGSNYTDYIVYYNSRDYKSDMVHQRRLPVRTSFKVDTGITVEDTEAPQLTAFSVSSMNIQPETKFSVTAQATDKDSGIDYIKARFVDKLSGRGISLSLELQEDGSWKEACSTIQSKYAGVYTLERVMLKDFAGNRSVLYPGQGILEKEYIVTINEQRLLP